ncbi:MAG: hypothetical protein ACOYMA_16715 [Bacteroidia bacterium]
MALQVVAAKAALTLELKTSYVDRGYLPFIIPYNDTSTRLFLKNGKDTLLFKSKGLKESYISGSSLKGDCPYHYENQQYTLRMAASDTDFFQINYYATIDESSKVLFYTNFHETQKTDLSWFIKYKVVQSLVVLNKTYDSVSISTNNYQDKIYSKLKFGVVKIENNNIYELIK